MHRPIVERSSATCRLRRSSARGRGPIRPRVPMNPALPIRSAAPRSRRACRGDGRIRGRAGARAGAAGPARAAGDPPGARRRRRRPDSACSPRKAVRIADRLPEVQQAVAEHGPGAQAGARAALLREAPAPLRDLVRPRRDHGRRHPHRRRDRRGDREVDRTAGRDAAGARVLARRSAARSTSGTCGSRSRCSSCCRSWTRGGPSACSTSTCSCCSAFGVSEYFFNKGNVSVSVPLVYPLLGYLLLRLALAGFRPRPRGERLMPYARTSWLVVGLVLLMVFRVGPERVQLGDHGRGLRERDRGRPDHAPSRTSTWTTTSTGTPTARSPTSPTSRSSFSSRTTASGARCPPRTPRRSPSTSPR